MGNTSVFACNPNRIKVHFLYADDHQTRDHNQNDQAGHLGSHVLGVLSSVLYDQTPSKDGDFYCSLRIYGGVSSTSN